MNNGDQVLVDATLASDLLSNEDGAIYYLVSVPGAGSPITVYEECVHQIEHTDAPKGDYFTKNLKRFRLLRNMSQAELAKSVGVAQGAVWQWEHGRTRPSHDNLVTLAKAMDVSVDTLLKRS